eukprot:CAMPEP_0182446154 /NCGR_PEP_ID=MMETSP1172-20130603/4023_1 /TAXON_ID=708627 /ORGANISM="Timspurckia oligopyrenoides, Strain CCMP3278" /LENGTH=627 /DNA_ID=CAMNT_0024642039 /DNA_START=137 /DNA_END=2020 /DNA_ORIENTATION=+
MVVTHPTSGVQITIGADVLSAPKLKPALEKAEGEGCDFIFCPLTHPRFDEGMMGNPIGLAKNSSDLQPFCRSEAELSGSEWGAGFIGRINPWLRLDSPVDKLRRFSEQCLIDEISFANYVSMQAVVISLPDPSTSAAMSNFARCICAALQSYGYTQILIRVPLNSISEDPPFDIWDQWNYIRSLCAGHPQLGVALEMCNDLPSKPALERWLAEPIQMFIVDRTAFVANKAGYPVLHKRHQDFLRAVFQYRPMFCLTGPENAKIKTDAGYRVYVQYIAHLFGKQPAPSESEQFQEPFHDYLQPLDAPFKINIDSQSFDIMDRDPVKYSRYQEAIAQCFQDRQTSENLPLVVAILGAGRGMMVAKVLEVAANNGRKVVVYAFEKNQNSTVSLQNMKMSQGWTNVFVISGDPHTWDTGSRADVVIADMIGALGDNELLPEYVDIMSRSMKDDCVVIPRSITSFIAPLTSPKLSSEVRLLGDGSVKWERPYLVAMNRAQAVAPPQPCFEFHFPLRHDMNQAGSSGFDRTECLSFGVPESVQLHGFAGYFEAHLYNDIVISTVPDTYSHGMLTWFSVFIPLARPVLLLSESFCQVQLWRRSEKGRVWYEWCLLSPDVSAVHNPNGRAFSIQL